MSFGNGNGVGEIVISTPLRTGIGTFGGSLKDQRDAYQTLVEQSIDAYMDLAYAPFTYYKKGLEAARKATR